MLPDCEHAGYRKFVCGACGDGYTVTLPETGHMWQVAEEGYTQEGAPYTVYVCSACGADRREEGDPPSATEGLIFAAAGDHCAVAGILSNDKEIELVIPSVHDGLPVTEIAEACREMSEQKTGALIVIPHISSLDFVIETGDRIDANINKRLIMNIFFKNSPLHDGAMVISNNHIIAARCTLPITEKTDIPAHYGMRHKAAIGISEETDADVIVVSEETGRISFVKGGNITPLSNANELQLLLNNSFAKGQQEG